MYMQFNGIHVDLEHICGLVNVLSQRFTEQMPNYPPPFFFVPAPSLVKLFQLKTFTYALAAAARFLFSAQPFIDK